MSQFVYQAETKETIKGNLATRLYLVLLWNPEMHIVEITAIDRDKNRDKLAPTRKGNYLKRTTYIYCDETLINCKWSFL